ncbi:MAG: hypothetical protein JWM33_338 [Caulobacteraceae bacterium]|nr:hypothetical protein [Caulobacteraceae bacterium]
MPRFSGPGAGVPLEVDYSHCQRLLVAAWWGEQSWGKVSSKMRPLSSLHALAFAAGLGLISPFCVHAQAPADPVGAVKDQAAGVTGSGGSMVLHVRGADGTDRILALGQVYEEGWTLTALSASAASFTRQGVTRQVGLNPTGAVATNAPPAATSVVIIPGGLTDFMERYSGGGSVDGHPVLKLGSSPGDPVLKIGDRLSDGWTLMRIGYELIFERGGQYQAIGFDAQRHLILGGPDQGFAPTGVSVRALTAPNLPDNLTQLSDDQRLSLYNSALGALEQEARARYQGGVAAWDIQAAIGLNRYLDFENLRGEERTRNLVSQTLVTDPTTGRTTGVLSVSVNPATGATTRLLSIGAGFTNASTLEEALQIMSPEPRP